MKQQTPLRKAIAEIEAKIEEEHYSIAIAAMTECISILTNLLPEERRVIEDAYGQGRDDKGRNGFGLSENDFFTSNFEQ